MQGLLPLHARYWVLCGRCDLRHAGVFHHKLHVAFSRPPAGCSMEEIIEAAKASNAHNFISALPKG